MIAVELNGDWRMRRTGETAWLAAKVPGSVLNDLLAAGRIGDPFFRDNEDQAREMAGYDYEYERDFTVPAELLACDRILLRCDGLDTLATVLLNGQMVAETANMHRTYELDIQPFLTAGWNRIKIILASPTRYIAAKQRAVPVWGQQDALPGFPHLRKAHHMFGWDWGPQIPDAGIWRDIRIEGYQTARLDDVHIVQRHSAGKVQLDVRVATVRWKQDQDQAVALRFRLTAPDGKVLADHMTAAEPMVQARLTVEDPELWWPNGYGKQPLYRLEVSLAAGPKERPLDTRQYQLGLRTLTVNRQPDTWGESFEFKVNGVAIFAMGANYIPEDNLLPRYTPERTARLIEQCVAANFNCLRVWGGGIYPGDYFYDLCDQYGLIVWQDLMFACAVYDLDADFTANIVRETADNVKRLRHHACLGLWCGNNEMEMGWVQWPFAADARTKHRTDYVKQFEIILPQVVRELDPETFFWPSSPSSGGGFEAPNDDDRGDVHYWRVWHHFEPFTAYREHFFRFCSEFGFQSFPCLKTVESFTLPEDRNIFSYIMEKHQKNGTANGKILYYLSDTFLYPKDFDAMLYVSQILQAEAIQYGVEHWRRNRGRCMGSLYWQLNDCWPVASWSSIDYYGRWKALHYYAKRFYAPLLLSALEEGTAVALHVTNDTLAKLQGQVLWTLRDNRSRILEQGKADFAVDPLTALQCVQLDFASRLDSKAEQRRHYLEYALVVDGARVSGGSVLFCKPKHFEFIAPAIRVEVMEEAAEFSLSVRSQAYARHVELDLTGADGVFSDNYFDLSAGTEQRIGLPKQNLSQELTLAELQAMLKVRSIYDIR